MDLDEGAFDRIAREALRRVEDAFADVDPDRVEVSASDGIVRLDCPGGVRIVVNSHRAARQIWLAAVASAWHFDPTPDGDWVSRRTGEALGPTVARLVAEHAGIQISL